jgi:anti-sigma B factor antagonist
LRSYRVTCKDLFVVLAERFQSSCVGAELVQWSVSAAGDEVTIAVVGEVDLSNAASLEAALVEVLEMKPGRIAIDLAGVSYLDSTGIRCLLNAAEHAAAAGSELVVCQPVGIVLRVLAICGVDELLLSSSDEDTSEAQ